MGYKAASPQIFFYTLINSTALSFSVLVEEEISREDLKKIEVVLDTVVEGRKGMKQEAEELEELKEDVTTHKEVWLLESDLLLGNVILAVPKTKLLHN